MRSLRRSRRAAVRLFPLLRRWGGMTPRENSSAGKRRTAGLSRQGESRLRKLFALGAATLMRNARSRERPRHPMAARRSRQAADEGRSHGAGRQDRQDRLGGFDFGQGLRAARGGQRRGPQFGEPQILGVGRPRGATISDPESRLFNRFRRHSRPGARPALSPPQYGDTENSCSHQFYIE